MREQKISNNVHVGSRSEATQNRGQPIQSLERAVRREE